MLLSVNGTMSIISKDRHCKKSEESYSKKFDNRNSTHVTLIPVECFASLVVTNEPEALKIFMRKYLSSIF